MADTIRTRAALVTALTYSVGDKLSAQDLRDFLISCVLRGDYDVDFIIGSPQLDDDGNSGHDARIFFDKSKGAFRAGKVTGDKWDEANIGNQSHGEGYNTKASASYSHAEGMGTYAEGDASHAEGYGTYASGFNSHAEGRSSRARLYAQNAHSGGIFAATGDCQNTKFQLRGFTNDETKTELVSYERFLLEDEHSYACTVTIHGRQSAGGNHAMYKRMLIIQRTGGTVALEGAVQTIGTDIKSDISWTIDLTADDTNKSLKVEVTGMAGQNIRWTALIETVELGYSS